LLRRRGPRHRDRGARAGQVRRADLRAPRDRAQHLRRQRPQGQGRDLHRGPGRGAARRDAGVLGPWREQGGAGGSAGARLRRVRRHLPAGDQGSRGSGQARQGRLRVHHDRPQGPPRSGGHDGPAGSRHPPGGGRGRCRPRAARAAGQACRGDADHPERGRRRRDHGRCAGALPQHPCAQDAGHLLRHPEPAGRREGPVAPGGRGDRGRQPHQQQQQPPGRAGPQAGRGQLHGRQRRRTAAAVAGGQGPRGPHGRRLGTRGAGARGDRPRQGAGRGVGAQDGRHRGDGEVPAAEGAPPGRPGIEAGRPGQRAL
ncbi:MAG: 4-hydroxy-3-methylbut-2-enyl diphosphate reductase, partial [uncultured Ramlibacter sp.]